jgi:hypothetical protein
MQLSTNPDMHSNQNVERMKVQLVPIFNSTRTAFERTGWEAAVKSYKKT